MVDLTEIFTHFALPPTEKEKTTREKLLADHCSEDAWDNLVSEV